jgi:hypothetical protein
MGGVLPHFVDQDSMLLFRIRERNLGSFFESANWAEKRETGGHISGHSPLQNGCCGAGWVFWNCPA